LRRVASRMMNRIEVVDVTYKKLRDRHELNLRQLRISPKIRAVFPDELASYTIFPYRIVHKKIQGFPGLDKWSSILILMPSKSGKKLKQLACKYRIIDNQIYMEEEMFNANWELIEHYLDSYINHNANVALKKANDIVDLSWYGHKNSVATLQAGKIKIRGKDFSEEEKRLRARRASAMDNPRILYIYREGDTVFHDKACKVVADFSDEEFRASETIPDNMCRCRFCRHMSFIRTGCGDDFKHYAAYKRFLQEDGKLYDSELERYVEHSGGRFRLIDKNVMQLFCGEDTWRIARKDNGKYILYHNNYTVINESERLFVDGFHTQNVQASSLRYLMNYISEYSWSIEHSKALKHRETEDVILEETKTCINVGDNQPETPLEGREHGIPGRWFAIEAVRAWWRKLIKL